jgi:hypothetical protein
MSIKVACLSCVTPRDTYAEHPPLDQTHKWRHKVLPTELARDNRLWGDSCCIRFPFCQSGCSTEEASSTDLLCSRRKTNADASSPSEDLFCLFGLLSVANLLLTWSASSTRGCAAVAVMLASRGQIKVHGLDVRRDVTVHIMDWRRRWRQTLDDTITSPHTPRTTSDHIPLTHRCASTSSLH